MPILVDYYTEVVYITSPTTTVTVQELVDAIRAAEDTPEGIAFGGSVATLQDGVADAEGKVTLKGSIDSGIIMTLHSDWYIEFWDGVVLGTVQDGNVAGGLASRPIRCEVGSSDTALVLGAVDTTIVGGGGGLTQEQVAQAVWNAQTSSYNQSGSFGEWLQSLPLIGHLIALVKGL